MKRVILALIIALTGTLSFAQKKVYWTTSGELIFSWGQLQFTDAYKALPSAPSIADMPVRFSAFYHFGENVHLDFSDKFGIFSGFGIHNIGMISDENIPNPAQPDANFKAKVVRRAYALGIPLALKFGSFDNNFHVYAGGEVEWAFHMKEKWWDQHSRNGTKTKNKYWFPSDKINPLQPSFFAGIQFPKGMNVKFRYYLTDFLNHNYITNNSTTNEVVSDLSKYKSSRLLYVSLSFNLKNKRFTRQPDKKRGTI